MSAWVEFRWVCPPLQSCLCVARVGPARLRLRQRRWQGLCSSVAPHWEIQRLMNVQLAPSVSSDYLDLNLLSNKHSLSRPGRHKPPFPCVLTTSAANWFIFSSRWNFSRGEAQERVKEGRGGERGGGGGEPSHFWWYYVLIISVNTGGWGSWAALSVDFSSHVQR